MRRALRFGLGVLLGGGALAAYLLAVGVDDVTTRAAAIAPLALGLLFVVVVLEGLADAIGVWASVEPLGDGLTPTESVTFALAGDFFDILSPAGPVTSEPIMAQFIGVATATTYSEALGVRSVAKYVKSGAQLLVSLVVGVVVLLGGTETGPVVGTLALAGGGLLVVGALVVRFRGWLSVAVAGVLTPVVARVSARLLSEPRGRSSVTAAIDRYWERVLGFRGEPWLLVLVAVGGVIEQVLVAGALWVALAGTGSPVALLPILVLVPLPQAASVVPVPASLGAYDLLLGGALTLVTGAPPPATAAAVLLFRTASLPFGLAAGGLSVAFLRVRRSAA